MSRGGIAVVNAEKKNKKEDGAEVRRTQDKNANQTHFMFYGST